MGKFVLLAGMTQLQNSASTLHMGHMGTQARYLDCHDSM
jgi:hypothetical protein